MKYYIASGVSNAARVNLVADVLNRSGHTRTYDWTVLCDVSGAPGTTKSTVARMEAQAVADAELVIVLLPGRFGTHAELGAAIATAQNKRIVLWSETEAPFGAEGPFCVFYHHPAVERLVCPFPALLSFAETL